MANNEFITSSFVRKNTNVSIRDFHLFEIKTLDEAKKKVSKILAECEITNINTRSISFVSGHIKGRLYPKPAPLYGYKSKKDFRKENKLAEVEGVVYLLKFDFEEMFIYKIGYSSVSAISRLTSILKSFVEVYGYSPKAKIVSYIKSDDSFNLEQDFLNYARDRSETKVVDYYIDGSSEFFYPNFDVEEWFLNKRKESVA